MAQLWIMIATLPSCHNFESEGEESGVGFPRAKPGASTGLAPWSPSVGHNHPMKTPNSHRNASSSARAMKCNKSVRSPLCVWVKAKRDGFRYYKNVCVCPEYPEWIRMVVRFEPCSSMLTHELTCIIHNPQISSFTTSHQSTLMLIALFPPTLTYFICTAQAAAWIKSYLVTTSKIWGICWEH